MKFAGIKKTTLIDYPGKVATLVFVHGCNLRCPFCHNPELVTEKFDRKKSVFESEVFKILKKRSKVIDAVAITGGEPLLQKDLLNFIKKVKKLGFLVKIDTNGTFPEKIENLLDYVDYWAIDVKNSKNKYAKTVGAKVKIGDILKSIEIIKKRAKDYEFRTTCVPGFHNKKSFEEIGKMVEGANKFYLQNYNFSEVIAPFMFPF